MLSNPVYDPYLILTKVYSEGARLKAALADTYIEEQYRSRTVKIAYGVLEEDGYLDFCIRFYAPKAPKLAVRTILKIGLYMLVFMDKKRYMVTDCAVDLCKKLGKSGVSGFVNAFLRRFDKAAVEQAISSPAVRDSYPEYAYRMLETEYGARAGAIAQAKSKGVSVRFERNAEAFLDKPHIATPFAGNYLFENFAREEGFDRGDYTFQSVGSIAICEAVEPCERFLDACAAPGGKSVLLAKKCKSVTSFELHPHRVELIRAYKTRMGIENVEERQKDSGEYDEEYEQAFDGALCDVPCSGFGTVSENPDVKLFRKESDFEGLGKAQRNILGTVSRYVKVGGALYYSTCSVFERENDAVVGEFLNVHPEYEAEQIDSPLPHEKKQYGLQFLPDAAYGAGFYVCKLRRKAV